MDQSKLLKLEDAVKSALNFESPFHASSPWEASDCPAGMMVWDNSGDALVGLFEVNGRMEPYMEPDVAVFIATFNPLVCRDLLEEIKRLKGLLKSVEG